MTAKSDIDPSADTLHAILQDLQRKYRNKRRRWAWSINRPYSEDVEKPPPGVLDLAADEDG